MVVLSDYLNSPTLRWGPLILTGFFLAAFVAFALRSALHGRPHTARVEKSGGSVLLSKYVMLSLIHISEPTRPY